MTDPDLDLRVRLAAFQWLRSQVGLIGEVLPRTLLLRGFEFGGVRVPLVSPQQGIFKPRIMTIPLSIMTTPNSPYRDRVVDTTGPMRYAYRGTNPEHPDNVGLRRAMQRRVPLIYFYGLSPGQYIPSFPVYITADWPSEHAFEVAIDDVTALPAESPLIAEDRAEIRREYITATVRRRLHQQAFRARVIEAYRTRCALCRLRHQELLDAAHITADSEATGAPVVSNGLALCKLHHAAFDRHFLTVRPDYVIEVRRSILEEEDGPMLLHGLKEMHERQIIVPREISLQPDRARLEQRFAEFQQMAGGSSAGLRDVLGR
jgi:putative restriction endonuclease